MKEKIKKIKERRRIVKKQKLKENKGITLIALVITIVLNCSCLAMERMNKFAKI